ncbi:alpha/beta hydrolase [Nonomuraea endophytica]|uniref:Acetyl esterase n=1 Tax=Nonomuraea endophytica TaxID=714136 RepID=A0A7W8A1F7_9ACTN|nr:alpha/beta hydrolase [Nonomuraea endophytica]MBB5076653.1 acetyl esterase [Nonomuraea endophytica]
MPVDPQIAPLIAMIHSQPPAPHDAVARRRMNAERKAEGVNPYGDYVQEEPEIATVFEERIKVADPDGEITVRVYRPAEENAGAMVLFHGGGWLMGTIDDSDRRSRAIAAGAGVVVVNVDYRLAPEFPFPVPAEDCYRAFEWTVEQAGRLGFDPARVGVGGESAGGNLSAAVSLLAKERGGPMPVIQVMEIPAFDLTMSSPTVETYAEGHVLTRSELEWCVGTYLSGHDATDPIASPLHAPDLSGLPPAVILSAECDPLAGDARRYAARLAEAGVPVTFREFPGHVHGSHTLTGMLASSRVWRTTVVTSIATTMTH